MSERLRVATRGSTLARTQAQHVADLLGADAELVLISTAGDRRVDADINRIGGQGVFVKDVQAAVLDGRADIAVHSAKDLPSSPSVATAGLVIAALPERADARDVLVGSHLDDLPSGARIGTGAIRRRAQLAWVRPDLTFASIRGNVDTRLAKLGAYDAIVVAAAALQRLGHQPDEYDVLDPVVMLPQVGQGARAVECRAGDTATRDRLAALDHDPTRRAVTAERAFLAELGGGCDAPVAAHATLDERDEAGTLLTLTGLLATGDGRVCFRHTAIGRDPVQLGREVARYLLDDAGGAGFLEFDLASPAEVP